MVLGLLSSRRKKIQLQNNWKSVIDQQLDARIDGKYSDQPAKLAAENPVSPDSIVDYVTRAGAVLLPAVIKGDALRAMQQEFGRLIDSAAELKFAIDRHDGATNIRVERSRLEGSQFPATTAFFSSHVLYEISEKYFINQTFSFNSEIFVHETPETQNPLSGALHYDKRHTLKFWIYIDDLPIEAGPMRIVPDSILENRARRNEAVANAKKYEEILNCCEDDDKAIHLSGPAGSVLIHDTDAFHGATPVMRGHVRRIMRGHCRSQTEMALIESRTRI